MWRSITGVGTAWTKRLAEAGETVENEGALRSKSRHERSTKQLRLKTYDALKLGPLNRSHLINVQRSSDKVESLGHIGNYLFCQRLRTHVSKQASRFGFSKGTLTSIKGTDALIFQLLRLRDDDKNVKKNLVVVLLRYILEASQVLQAEKQKL